MFLSQVAAASKVTVNCKAQDDEAMPKHNPSASSGSNLTASATDPFYMPRNTASTDYTQMARQVKKINSAFTADLVSLEASCLRHSWTLDENLAKMLNPFGSKLSCPQLPSF